MRQYRKSACLSIEIRNQFALQRCNHIFQNELALFESANAQLVNHRVMLQSADKVVEVSVTDTQLAQILELLKRFRIDFVGHSAMLLAVRQQRQPVPVHGSDDEKGGVEHVRFRIIFHRFAVECHDASTGLFDDRLGRCGVPL